MHKTLKRKFDLRLLRLFVAFGVLLLSYLYSYAEDLTTLDGKIFTNITEVTKYPKLVVFTYNSNRTSVAISNLPEGFRTKYGIKIITNEPTISVTQTQANPTDSFLRQNSENKLLECESNETSLTNGMHKSWQICLQGVEISLTKYIDDNSYKTINRSSMHFNVGEENVVSNAFDKFIEWDGVAEKNKAEPFEKVITIISRSENLGTFSLDRSDEYKFSWDSNLGGSSLSVMGSSIGVFDKQDVINFQKLLNVLPDLKEKIVKRIRNLEVQKDLFK